MIAPSLRTAAVSPRPMAAYALRDGDLNVDISLLSGAEAGVFHGEAIYAGGEGGNRIVTGGAGDSLIMRFGAGVNQCELGAGNQRAGGVGDCAGDGAAVLREGKLRQCQTQKRFQNDRLGHISVNPYQTVRE